MKMQMHSLPFFVPSFSVGISFEVSFFLMLMVHHETHYQMFLAAGMCDLLRGFFVIENYIALKLTVERYCRYLSLFFMGS